MTALLWETRKHLLVSDTVYKRFLRLPLRRVLEGPMAEAAADAREWFAREARPWGCAIATDPARWTLASAKTRGATALALVAVSTGVEVAEETAARWARDEPDRAFFLDRLAAATVEVMLAAAKRELGSTYHDCPGFWDWPIQENSRLLSALQAECPLPGPLDVLDSGMLRPKTSQLALCTLPARESAPTEARVSR